jgi:hypothetical protein
MAMIGSSALPASAGDSLAGAGCGSFSLQPLINVQQARMTANRTHNGRWLNSAKLPGMLSEPRDDCTGTKYLVNSASFLSDFTFAGRLTIHPFNRRLPLDISSIVSSSVSHEKEISREIKLPFWYTMSGFEFVNVRVTDI